MDSRESKEAVKKDINTYSHERLIRAVVLTAFEMKLPMAFWRMPQSTEMHLVVSFNEVIGTPKPDLEEIGSGFSFSPFSGEEDTLFIPADFHCTLSTGDPHTSQSLDKSDFKQAGAPFFTRLTEILNGSAFINLQHTIFNGKKVGEYSNDYLNLIASAIQEIKNGRFQKVVPARRKSIALPSSFDLVDTLMAISEAYPNTFISLVSIPEVGTWMGATPEVLLEVEGKSVFKTVALAATQKREIDKAPSETAWTQKEIEEQAMVSRYVINCFKKIRLREFEEKGPKTVIAGNLLHLKTEYQVDMVETSFPQLGTVMLDLLHPTSAVAGMPKEEALSFLDEKEGFDREFFSGFLGPVNIEHSTNIFVNLRCMKLLEHGALLYAGAGVTEDSIPEKELAETDLKFNTLLNIIKRED